MEHVSPASDRRIRVCVLPQLCALTAGAATERGIRAVPCDAVPGDALRPDVPLAPYRSDEFVL